MKKYNPIAVKATSNFGGICIYDIRYDIEDSVLVGEDHGVQKTPHWSKIRTNMNGDSYFIHYGRREHLSDYMRIN